MLKQNAGFEGPPLHRGTGETEGNDHEGLQSVQRFIMVERSLREVRLNDHGNQRDDTCCDTDPRTGVGEEDGGQVRSGLRGMEERLVGVDEHSAENARVSPGGEEAVGRRRGNATAPHIT